MRQMDEMGVRMVEKVCRREEKRLRMTAFEGGCCHVENGVLTAVFATRPEKNFFLPRAQKFPREHDKRDK